MKFTSVLQFCWTSFIVCLFAFLLNTTKRASLPVYKLRFQELAGYLALHPLV